MKFFVKCLATVVALTLIVYGFSTVLSTGGNTAALGAAQAQGAKDIDGSVKAALRELDAEFKTLQAGVYESDDEKFVTRFHVLAEQDRLMVLTILKEKVSERFRPAVIEYLTRVNYDEMIIGNFEMDLSDGEVQFRASIDVEFGVINPEMVTQLTAVAVWHADKYAPGIKEVCAGKTPEQALNAIKKADE